MRYKSDSHSPPFSQSYKIKSHRVDGKVKDVRLRSFLGCTMVVSVAILTLIVLTLIVPFIVEHLIYDKSAALAEGTSPILSDSAFFGVDKDGSGGAVVDDGDLDTSPSDTKISISVVVWVLTSLAAAQVVIWYFFRKAKSRRPSFELQGLSARLPVDLTTERARIKKKSAVVIQGVVLQGGQIVKKEGTSGDVYFAPSSSTCAQHEKIPDLKMRSKSKKKENSKEKMTRFADMTTSAMIELDSLQKKFGKFSYYLWRGKLVVHLEDTNSRQNQDCITAAVNKISQRFLQSQYSASVEVSSNSLNAALCIGIGSTLIVNHMQQTTGMYVLYKGVVYWVSAAHNYVRSSNWNINQAAFNANPLLTATQVLALGNVLIDFGDEQLRGTDNPMVQSPMSYACLKHKPRDSMGRILMHSVDIMIGPVPMVARQNDTRERDNLQPLREVRGRAELIYRIKKVWRPTPSVGNEPDNYSRYDITREEHFERYKHVTAMLPGNNLAEGTIEPSFGSIYLSGEVYHNVILISSSNGISPRFGDSGSVWVSRDSSEAVAITVGKMSPTGDSSVEVWVALLLFPCLEVFCLEHRHTFLNVGLFASFEGQALVDDEPV